MNPHVTFLYDVTNNASNKEIDERSAIASTYIHTLWMSVGFDRKQFARNGHWWSVAN